MSHSYSTTEIESSLTTQPNKLEIELSLNKETYIDLQLHNNASNNAYILFKIKTTAKDRYMLRPTADIIPPYSTKLCKIFMSKFNDFIQLNDKNTRDKFLIQSYVLTDTAVLEQLYDTATDTVKSDALATYWKKLESEHSSKQSRYIYSEQIIKCKLIVPDTHHNDTELHNDTNSMINTSVQSIANTVPLTASIPDNTIEPRTTSVNAIRNKFNTTTDVSQYDRIDAERNKSDYAELMDFTVKLTAQLEKAKADYTTLNTQYNQLQSTNTQLTKQIALLKQQSDADSKLLSTAGIKATPRLPDTLPPVDSTSDKGTTVSMVTSTGLSILQIFVIALIAYLVGKFYR